MRDAKNYSQEAHSSGFIRGEWGGATWSIAIKARWILRISARSKSDRRSKKNQLQIATNLQIATKQRACVLKKHSQANARFVLRQKSAAENESSVT